MIDRRRLILGLAVALTAGLVVAVLLVLLPGGDGDGPPGPRFSLTADKFGDGVITSSPGGIDCGSGCTVQSAEFSAGANVELEAEPDPGSELAHWVGCDSVSGNSCTVNADADKTVFATFALSRMEIADNVRVLDEGAVAGMTAQEGSTYRFQDGIKEIEDLDVGDIIVSHVDGGFLRTVTGVEYAGDFFSLRTLARNAAI